MERLDQDNASTSKPLQNREHPQVRPRVRNVGRRSQSRIAGLLHDLHCFHDICPDFLTQCYPPRNLKEEINMANKKADAAWSLHALLLRLLVFPIMPETAPWLFDELYPAISSPDGNSHLLQLWCVVVLFVPLKRRPSILAWDHSRGNGHVGRSILCMRVHADRTLNVEVDMSSTQQFQSAFIGNFGWVERWRWEEGGNTTHGL